MFETTDADVVALLNTLTRPTGDSFDYAIPVVEDMGSVDNGVRAIPLWHVNQYTRGVTPGEGGGPDPNGQRNIINLDRGVPGYSPLWDLWWVSEVPINYLADEVSNSADLTADNGFTVLSGLSMFVNCPDIGAVGAVKRDLDASPFSTEVDADEEENWVLGALVMEGGVPIEFQLAVLASTVTNMMGAY